MAIAIGATATTKTVRLVMKDINDEETIKTFSLDGAMTNADIVTLLGHLEALENAQITKASLSTEVDITGMRATPLTVLWPDVTHFMGLTFEKVDPLNAAKMVRKGFVVPAYLNSLNIAGVPDATDSDLAALITSLNANLQFIDHSGTASPGDFTYNAGRSGFGTATRRIDGLPG